MNPEENEQAADAAAKTSEGGGSILDTDFQELLDQAQALIAEFGLKLIAALLVFFIGKMIAKGLVGLMRRTMEKRKVDPTLATFGTSIGYVILMTLVIIAALGTLGVQTTSFIALIGAAGLAIGFALQGSLSNFAAGVLLIAFRPFEVGHVVSIAGEFGTVKEVQMFTTVLLTPQNTRVIVPNNSITSGNITNYTVEGDIRIDMVFGIGYGDDIPLAKSILEEIVGADARIKKDPAATIAVVELGDSSVNLACNIWANVGDKWGIWFDTHEAVKSRFDEAGISIPFPQQDVHMHQVGG